MIVEIYDETIKFGSGNFQTDPHHDLSIKTEI